MTASLKCVPEISSLPVSADDIAAARARIQDNIRPTPVIHSETLSRESGCQLYLKLENLQVTGCYKERGALNALLQLTPEERERGVIAASAGNHAQAVSYHAGRLGIRSRIFMPLYTPLVKITATERWGAEVVLHGDTFDDSLAEARRRAEETGAVFLHAFNDRRVIAGQGTIGLELLEQIPDLGAVVVPVGGGGLIGGIACAVKSVNPGIQVIGVEPETSPAMLRAIKAGKIVNIERKPTIADGVLVRRVGDLTFELAQKWVDEIVTVEEEAIAKAILYLLERQKILSEGAGALGLAALLDGKSDGVGKSDGGGQLCEPFGLKGKKTAIVISGGNIDVMLLSNIIERGLVKDGRLIRLRISLPDHPGSLHRLTTKIAHERANIVHVVHDRAYYGVHLGQAKIDVTAETRSEDHAQQLMDALRAAGYQFERVQ